MSRYRKAVAAFVTPLLGLPVAGWISGDIPFDESILAGAIVAGLSALLTWRFPNAEAPSDS